MTFVHIPTFEEQCFEFSVENMNEMIRHCRIVNVKYKDRVVNGVPMIFWPKGPLSNMLVGSPPTENGRFVGSATD